LKPRLIIILLLIVILPLAILGWLGGKVARSERENARHRLQAELVRQLRYIDNTVAQLIETRERALLSERALSALPHETLRERVRRSGVVRQYFVLDDDGGLAFPSPAQPLTASEKTFLERTGQIWLGREIPAGGGQEYQPTLPASQQMLGKGQQAERSVPVQKAVIGKGGKGVEPAISQHGWHGWYWGNGINLIFWWRDEMGVIVGAELDRVRLMADVVGILPETPLFDTTSSPVELSAGPSPRIVLVDSKGTAIYQWGSYEPADGEESLASLSLSPPLSAWKLEYFAPADFVGAGYGRGALFNVLSGLGVLAVALIALAVYFYRESSREMREAAQRVSFVNQVSHELKTPLTSIRMYAEILEDEVGETDEKQQKHLDVIVSESQRLSRLIGNVLTFSRKQRSALKLYRTPGVVDDVLRTVLDSFEAGLRNRGIEIVFSGGADLQAEFDHDAVEQIVGNLLSNVEKYAAAGDRVEVRSAQDGDTVTVTVTDNGPGIPLHERARIFEPFHRVSNKLTDGVAGTGIGLAIARDLARLHGGDLTLEPTDQGACFKMVIQASGDM